MKKLTFREIILVASMLFGMFFGAGNLIFPVYMGQMAGRNMWPALIGFIITGVGLPLLGVAALGISRSSGSSTTPTANISTKAHSNSAGFSPRAEKRAHGPLPPRARR